MGMVSVLAGVQLKTRLSCALAIVAKAEISSAAKKEILRILEVFAEWMLVSSEFARGGLRRYQVSWQRRFSCVVCDYGEWSRTGSDNRLGLRWLRPMGAFPASLNLPGTYVPGSLYVAPSELRRG